MDTDTKKKVLEILIRKLGKRKKPIAFVPTNLFHYDTDSAWAITKIAEALGVTDLAYLEVKVAKAIDAEATSK